MGWARALFFAVVAATLIAAGAAQPGVVRAAETDWSGVGPEGGSVTAFAAGGGVVYVGTDTAGVFRSANGGASWTPARVGLLLADPAGRWYPQYFRVTALLVDPAVADRVYAGTDHGEIFRSDDAGASWRLMQVAACCRSAETVMVLAADPVRAGRLYAQFSGGTGLLATGDGFATVSTLPVPAARALAVDGDGRLIVGTGGDGVYISADGGQTFVKAQAWPADAFVGAVGADPATGAFFATIAGIGSRSDDGGGTATAVPALDGFDEMLFGATDLARVNGVLLRLTGTGWTPEGPGGVQALGASGGVLLAGTDRGVHRDSGAGWALANAGLDAVEVADLVVDPADPMRLFALQADTSRVFRSTNGGSTWAASEVPGGVVRQIVIDPFHTGAVHLATSGGLYRSADGGATWSLESAAAGRAVAASRRVADKLYATGGPGQAALLRSVDGGDSWVPVPGPWSGSPLRLLDVSVVPTMPESLFVTTGIGRLWRSTDSGAHWTLELSGHYGPLSRTVVSDPRAPRHLMVRNGRDLMESTDAGVTWNSLNSTLPHLGHGDPTFDPVRPTIVYLVAADAKRPDHSIFISYRDGDVWTKWEPVVGGQQVSELALSTSGPVYAAGWGSGIRARSVADTTAPGIASAPRMGFLGGSTIDLQRVPVRVAWSGVDRGSGIASYALQHRVGSAGLWTDVPLSPVFANSRVTNLMPTFAHQFQVKATDNAGNESLFRAGPRRYLALLSDRNAALAYEGNWFVGKSRFALNKATMASEARSASMTYSFMGSAFGWVSPKGPARGSAVVFVDGVKTATVSLTSAAFQARRVVFARTWDQAAAHTVRIVVGAGGRVDVDGVLALR